MRFGYKLYSFVGQLLQRVSKSLQRLKTFATTKMKIPSVFYGYPSGDHFEGKAAWVLTEVFSDSF